ncbi:hypothetical protein PUNSTDRAFT_77359 [Punctularia strigosozonata HHB-11173 SS5]|uniref:Pericentrin/AKAP-450 centrosomal targeting domain-containing protein n=1 Tax=Punctularia strigosozonata (strain HHB-11173) TaxID=741275 RepID=R7S0E8_PUNST|nr:uncharacterized protein PUNSTDRAFT_77359 [Punctularia strigosozonata HHB-11173 SS5]EIN03865.1 hypothetical protein PUNSTDRAFT_77359 [Punctularia strigosozonata HHB-11173 SS5]
MATTTPPTPPGGTPESADGHDEEKAEQEDTVSELASEQTERAIVPATPAFSDRRRSFLIDVINSTARPKMRFAPTPHPRRVVEEDEEGEQSETPAPAALLNRPTPAFTPGARLFAGITPRPRARARLSHPLTQAWTANAPVDAASEADTASVSPSADGLSPYDDRASVASSASSHDLTTRPYARANASFDPVMGLAAHGHGVGKFNATKLNAYLHGLNRRLQQENEALLERLERLEGEHGSGSVVSAGGEANASGRRLSMGSAGSAGRRRVSVGGSNLGDVVEEDREKLEEERAMLEEMVEELKEEETERALDKCLAEKEQQGRELEQEREARARDKERWKERMGEVEQGVSEIVKGLEAKVVVAEKKAEEEEEERKRVVRALERKLADLEDERDQAVQRAEKADVMLKQGKDLGGELAEANERIAQLTGELRSASSHIKDLEDDIERAEHKVEAMQKDMQHERRLIAELEDEVEAKSNDIKSMRQRLERAEEAKEELRKTKAYIAEVLNDAAAAADRIEALEHDLAATQEKLAEAEEVLDEANEKKDAMEIEAERANELARQMEEALEAAEERIRTDEEDVASLRTKIASLEREIERQREESRAFADPSRTKAGLDDQRQAEIDALENELDEANREIARLNTVLSQSPARKAIDKAKDAKIEVLEKEKEELLERVKSLRSAAAVGASTPNRLANLSTISPMHRHALSMSIHFPKTPGGPLRDLTWLNQTTHDPAAAPLLAEIARLQAELGRANESIDDKLDKLDDAGQGVVGLTRKLEDARAKIIALEEEIARLSRREDRRMKRLERARCTKCRSKVDLSGLGRAAVGDESSLDVSTVTLPSDPATPPTRTSEALRADLRAVNAELSTLKANWESERRHLLGENAVLKDATNKLNSQIRDAKAEAKRAAEGVKSRMGIEGELDDARRMIAALEADLQEERARLRRLATDKSKAEREKEDILLQVHRVESDMDAVKEQLQRAKRQNHDLEADLRANTNAEQKVRLLEARVAENADVIERLRDERSLLANDHKQLQQRYAEVSKSVNKLRGEYAATQSSHEGRRQQLDDHLHEIEELRRLLSQQADELHRAQQEQDRIAVEKNDVARTVANLEADLRRVKRDAESLGRDLKILRAEKDKGEAQQVEEVTKARRALKQTQSELRIVTEQLERYKEKATAAQDRLRSHVCAVDDKQIANLRLQHNKECKGLIVQIRYLKAKFTREASLRCDLIYQKQYLLVLLSQHTKTEKKVLAAIAKIGFAVPPPARRKRLSLKGAASAIMFLSRAKRASDSWREQSATKQAVAAALQEVRRKRIAAS